MASAKTASAIDVRIDDMSSILNFRIGFPCGENSAGFCKSVWLPGSILNFRIGSVSSIGGLIAATLFADTASDSQNYWLNSLKQFFAAGIYFGDNSIRGWELNTNFFSQTFRVPPGYPGKLREYPAKKFGIPGFWRTYRTFWPPPLHVEDPHPTWRYPDQKVWVWVLFFFPEVCWSHVPRHVA